MDISKPLLMRAFFLGRPDGRLSAGGSIQDTSRRFE